MDSDMHIASYPQLQLIQRQHLLRVQQHANAPARPRASSLLLSPVASAWRASNAAAGLTFPSPPVGAPAHGTVGTYADLASHGNLPAGASLAQRGGNRVDPLFNPQNTSNVYINGLPTYFPTSQLYDLCAEFGPIASVRTFDRLNTPEPSTYGFVLFEDVESARRCIVALRQYSDLHPSFAKTQKIPQASSDTQFNDIHTKRMQRLQLFDNATQFLSTNPPALQTQPLPQPEQVQDETWRARVASAPIVMQGAPSTGRPKFGGARSSLETVLEDPGVMPETQADLFVQGLPLHLQPYELEALFAPHKIMDSRVCQVPGVGGLPDSISGVMRLSSMAAAREIMSKLDGLRFPGWSHSLKITLIDNKNNEEDDDAAFEVQPGRAPGGVGLGVPSIRSATQAFSGRRVVSTPVGSGAGVDSVIGTGAGGGAGPAPVGTMASIHAPRVDAGVPARRSPNTVASDGVPIYSTVGSAVGSERSSPIGSERPILPPLQLDAAFSPRARSGSGSTSDGSMSPVSPALTFTSAGRTPTMATIATPRYEGEELVKVGGGMNVKCGGHEGEDVELTALAVGLAGLDD